MRVGLTLDFRNSPRRRRPWREFWEDGLWLLCEAEVLGFDSVLVQEHFFTEDGYAPSAPVFLALLAERTRRVRIGTYVQILPLHHPAQLAQQTAVLDQFSGGRLDVGVGLGHSLAEYRALGVDPRTRAGRMDEALTVLRRAWTERPFTFEGRHYCLHDLEVRPEPLQQPHPPLWVAATTPAAAARAGRHGAYLLAGTAEAELADAYRASWRAAGHPPGKERVCSGLTVTTTVEDPTRVWERNRALYYERWDFYRRIRSDLGLQDIAAGPDAVRTAQDRTVTTPESYRDHELIGDPQTVLAALEPVAHRLGATDLIINGPASGIDWRGEGYRSVRLFAEKVLPTLHTWN
jgi:alkanesulfonate monooxygenase SsuD/methylene tetrahydromethanopterin reductase-like flavin-dependent oxidoreductase (luciferase family)